MIPPIKVPAIPENWKIEKKIPLKEEVVSAKPIDQMRIICSTLGRSTRITKSTSTKINTLSIPDHSSTNAHNAVSNNLNNTITNKIGYDNNDVKRSTNNH